MIIRSSFKCLTCDQTHTVRIGMGQEEYQSHKFQCQNCGEDMVVGMHVDYEKIGARPEAVENAELSEEIANSPIVNVDANFMIPVEERHSDLSFPRLHQMQKMAEAAKKAGTLIAASSIPKGMEGLRPYRRPDVAAEWKDLRKAWSLHRNGRKKLSEKCISAASKKYYASDPLTNLEDWLWRFVLFLGQPKYELKFKALFNEIQPLLKKPKFSKFIEFYDNELSTERGTRYFELIKSYFSAYSEFGQVYFLISQGVEIPEGNVASSLDFDATRMFYGNAFETFASSVDILAYLNNLILGRNFDSFETLTKDKYLKLDKASRFGAFSLNSAFTSLCEEKDNQLRNASHHGSFKFNTNNQEITYRSGKGGTGPENILHYTTYLARCTRIFLQVILLLRAEILMCHAAGKRVPL